MKTRIAVALTVACAACLPPLRAQATVATAPAPAPAAASPAVIEKTHNELRAVRDGLVRAINAQDLDGVLSYLHPNVVVTFQDAGVCRGHQAVRDYFTRMMSGPDRIVRGFHIAPVVDELTILYGDDTGIAFGSDTDDFDLTSGMKFRLKGRWTATMVKENGRWLIASFHASTNLFDNPLLDLAKQTARWVALGALVLGLLVGFFAARLLGRKRAA
ncbi:MAG TPA: nuclear transport factor 2 family protein [Thermoanaerobaculia bacterium]